MYMATHAYSNTRIWQHTHMATHAYGNTCMLQHTHMATRTCIWHVHMPMATHVNDLVLSAGNHGRPQEFFQGGANLWGGPKKICEGGPPYFFRQALKYAYRGGGGSFDARRVFF